MATYHWRRDFIHDETGRHFIRKATITRAWCEESDGQWVVRCQVLSGDVITLARCRDEDDAFDKLMFVVDWLAAATESMPKTPEGWAEY
jgi:hypothetical protein